MEEELSNLSDPFEHSSFGEFFDETSSGYIDDDSKSANVPEVVITLSSDATINKGFLEINSYTEEAGMLSSPDDFILEEARSIADELLKHTEHATPKIKLTESTPETPKERIPMRSMVSSTPILRKPLSPLKVTRRNSLRIKNLTEVASTPSSIRALKFEDLQDEEDFSKISAPTRQAVTPSPLHIVGCSNNSPIIKTPLKSLNKTWHYPTTSSVKESNGCANDSTAQILKIGSRSLSTKCIPVTLMVESGYHPPEEAISTYKPTPKSKRFCIAEFKENIPPE